MARGARRQRILTIPAVRAARANGRSVFMDGRLRVTCRSCGWTAEPARTDLPGVREVMLRDDLAAKYGP